MNLNSLVKKSFNTINKLVPILLYRNDYKFLHNLKYTHSSKYFSESTFEGYLNCGATCYILGYILNNSGYDAKLVKTVTLRESRYFDHVYLVYKDLIIDPTYRQLFRDSEIQNDDLFMKNLYNKKSYAFIGNKDRLEKLVENYNQNFIDNYKAEPFKVLKHYTDPVDIDKVQDFSKVLENKEYAKKKVTVF